jgi:hypothetical protein
MAGAGSLEGLSGRKDLGLHPAFRRPSPVAHAVEERNLILTG